ncbi:molecular chaperone HtpG [Glycomyces harbinensis]|uniref:Molecular chaperone HtpG n=1 Tax=Glycomyces harbinensis TaxID=58114 RepID=A0A1G7DH14_9ACTN|nr:HSP90 family protein [Glycomyces harbinensis]SDE50861.1 molecular chaperone HtpG [Glycomyces harbinensis]
MSETTPTSHTFQVDLRGLVDLLSHHLYSSPKVYVRELLQNAVDAVTARRAVDPAFAEEAPEVRIVADGKRLRITDPGVGLTVAEVHQLLATIGGSSKRDEEIEGARRDFLGQFGIGLLACFTVASVITVTSRSAKDPEAGAVRWTACDDGSYTVVEVPLDEHPRAGTTVELVSRPGEDWLKPEKVAELAREYGSLLPVRVTVEGDGAPVRITDTPPVWERAHPTPTARRLALNTYCESVMGFPPLDVIDLDVPLSGIKGVAFVLPHATSPSARPAHRVHLKRMLLTETADNLVPEWAFFVRCVVDTDSLRPTASRESLYDDEALAVARDAIGAQIREWISRLASADPDRLEAFLAVHELGVKALARHDAELLSAMLPWLRFETTAGHTSLPEFARAYKPIYLAATVDEYRQVAQIAAAQGIGVVNGGYTYDAELVQALPRMDPQIKVESLQPGVISASLDPLDTRTELGIQAFLNAARARLDAVDVDVVMREFNPVSVPALLLDDREARRERQRAEAEVQADDLWGGILASIKQHAPRAQLVLNHRNPTVRRVSAIGDPDLAGTAVESLYGQALLMSRRPLRSTDTALLNRSFMNLLEHVTRTD